MAREWGRRGARESRDAAGRKKTTSRSRAAERSDERDAAGTVRGVGDERDENMGAP